MIAWSSRTFIVAVCVLVLVQSAAAQTDSRLGVLLLAHGGKPDWNERVMAIAKAVDTDAPVEVAFGMATRPNIQHAVDQLVARGVSRIVAVPLFVSSHSSVITSTEYLLGLRAEMPPDLARFAKMSHGGHGDHTPASAEDNTKPVASPIPIAMTSALNHHPLVAAMLADRARSISKSPASEAVIVVAHGPVPDQDNQRWLADMKVLSNDIRAVTTFASIDYLTVRDDAPKPVRDAATEELRTLVSKRASEGKQVLIVPLLLSFGGIEQGIRDRLKGLEFRMAEQGLTPDDRIVQWVRDAVRGMR